MMTKRMWGVVGVMCLMAPAHASAQVQVQEPPVHRVADPVSGAEVRVYRSEPGATRFDVADGRVTVRKTVRGRSSETTILTDQEVIRILIAPGQVRVDGTRGVQVLGPGDRPGSERLTRRLAESSAVREALGILARVSTRSTSPIAQAVVSTRVMLNRLSGERDAASAIARSVHGPAPERLLRVGLIDGGPGECWEEYAQEAIEAYTEYEDCVDSKNWWDLAGIGGCLAIYEMRAIGAFSWWMSCVALRG